MGRVNFRRVWWRRPHATHATEMRDGEERVPPVGPAHLLMGALLVPVLPDVHADAHPAAGDELDFVIPPVPREVETFPHLGTEELVVHLRAARAGRGDHLLDLYLGGGLLGLGFFGPGPEGILSVTIWIRLLGVSGQDKK